MNEKTGKERERQTNKKMKPLQCRVKRNKTAGKERTRERKVKLKRCQISFVKENKPKNPEEEHYNR